jgi:hypothetical protein
MSIYNKPLKTQLAALGNALGLQVGYDVGCIYLDNVPCSNQWRLVKKTKNGLEASIFGHNAYTKKQWIDLIQFALRCMQLDRLDGKESAQYWPTNKCEIN